MRFKILLLSMLAFTLTGCYQYCWDWDGAYHLCPTNPADGAYKEKWQAYEEARERRIVRGLDGAMVTPMN